jgi:hypothetical protein
MYMVKKYVCAKCYEEFLSIEDIVNHMKNSHPEVEDIDSYIDIIDLESREWTDISETIKRIKLPPIATMPSVPPELVPEGFVRIEDMPYYYKDKSYYCSPHKKTYDIENDFLMHILAEHPRDFDRVLKFVVKRSLLAKELDRVKEGELKKTIDKEVHQWFMKAEQQQPEALSAYVEDFFDRLLNFLKGDDDICPICNRLYTIQNQLHLDKIFQCLKKGIELQGGKLYQTLKAWEQQGKPWEFWKVCKYLCKWNNKQVWLSLYPLLHIYQDHRGTFDRLVKDGILQGIEDKDSSIIDFLYEKQYLKKTKQPPILKASEPTEKLSKAVVVKKQVNLSKGEDALLKWLDKERVKKE